MATFFTLLVPELTTWIKRKYGEDFIHLPLYFIGKVLSIGPIMDNIVLSRFKHTGTFIALDKTLQYTENGEIKRAYKCCPIW